MRLTFLSTSSLHDPSPRGRWLPLAQELAARGHTVRLIMLHPTYDRLPVRERRQERDRKSTRLNSSHLTQSRMPSSA